MAHGYDQKRFQKDVPHELFCVICLNVLKDPVLCRQNEHSFCRACITRFLTRSNFCPMCRDELTVGTLAKAPKIYHSFLSSLKIQCDYYERGCREVVLLECLEKHIEECGFAPVRCSNDNCQERVNKRDLVCHVEEFCKFRTVKCHDCVRLATEMDLIHERLGYISRKQKEGKDETRDCLQKCTTLTQSLYERQEHFETTLRDLIRSEIRALSRENAPKIPRIVVVGGKSVENTAEVYDFSENVWTPMLYLDDARFGASVFTNDQQIYVSGGVYCHSRRPTNIITTLDAGDINTAWLHSPIVLPAALTEHTTVGYNGSVYVIGGHDANGDLTSNIWQVELTPPYKSQVLSQMPEGRWRHCSVLVNNMVYICGGSTARSGCVNSVLGFDIAGKICQQLPVLPYKVTDMASVKYGENIVVIGGCNEQGRVLSTVFIYEPKSGNSYFLPAMIQKRYGCSAVVVGNEIIVIGGGCHGDRLSSVEVFSFESYSWREFPPMQNARFGPTAVTI